MSEGCTSIDEEGSDISNIIIITLHIYIFNYIYIYLTSYNILVGDMSCDGEDFVGTGPDALGSATVDLWEEGAF